MNRLDEQENGLGLKVNGSLLAVGKRPALDAWTPALRGIALSDSPVLIQASHQDAAYILERIHALGRRRDLPVHHCHTEDEGQSLLHALQSDGTVHDEALGTWAVFNVHWWSDEAQSRLADLLGELDEARLHGRLRHDRIPRVVVTMNPDTQASSLRSGLRQRLAYYHLSAVMPKTKGFKDAPA